MSSSSRMKKIITFSSDAGEQREPKIKTGLDIEYENTRTFLESYKNGATSMSELVGALMADAPTITKKLLESFNAFNTKAHVELGEFISTHEVSERITTLFSRYGIIRKTNDIITKYELTEKGEEALKAYYELVASALDKKWLLHKN